MKKDKIGRRRIRLEEEGYGWKKKDMVGRRRLRLEKQKDKFERRRRIRLEGEG